jgi:hypothetical protein
MPVWGWVCLGLVGAPVAFLAFLAFITIRYNQKQNRLMREGQTVVARILLANPYLYDARDSTTFGAAFVVFTLDNDTSEEHLAYLAEICEKLEDFRPRKDANADERKIAKALADQTTIGHTPLRIPDRLTGGREAYFATPNVMRRMLPGKKLTEDYILLQVIITKTYRDCMMIEYPEED